MSCLKRSATAGMCCWCPVLARLKMTCRKSLSIRVQSALSAISKAWQNQGKTTKKMNRIERSKVKSQLCLSTFVTYMKWRLEDSIACWTITKSKCNVLVNCFWKGKKRVNQLKEYTHLCKTVHVPLLCIRGKQGDIRVRAWVNSCIFHHSQDILGTLKVPKMAVCGQY